MNIVSYNILEQMKQANTLQEFINTTREEELTGDLLMQVEQECKARKEHIIKQLRSEFNRQDVKSYVIMDADKQMELGDG